MDADLTAVEKGELVPDVVRQIERPDMPRMIEKGGDLGIPVAGATRYMSIAATIVIEPPIRGTPPLPVTRELAEFTA